MNVKRINNKLLKKTFSIPFNDECDCHAMNVCPDCLSAESEELWPIYYSQYRDFIENVIDGLDFGNSILPIGLLISHYIEIWIKTIANDYGNICGRNIGKKIKGHRLLISYDKLCLDILSYEEFCGLKEYWFEVRNLIDYFEELSFENSTALTESMRYPTSNSDTVSINRCLYAFIMEECDKFDLQQYRENVRRLMDLTDKLYDTIYDYRLNIHDLKV